MEDVGVLDVRSAPLLQPDQNEREMIKSCISSILAVLSLSVRVMFPCCGIPIAFGLHVLTEVK